MTAAVLPSVGAVILLMAVVVLEAFSFRRLLKKVQHFSGDRSTFLKLLLAYMCAARLMRATSYDHPTAGWLGLVVMLLGFSICIWAVRARQRAERNPSTAGRQFVCFGPYRWVRYPQYFGRLLVWSGAGITAERWPAALSVTLMIALAYMYRINAEERSMTANVTQNYRVYTRRTARLLPFIL